MCRQAMGPSTTTRDHICMLVSLDVGYEKEVKKSKKKTGQKLMLIFGVPL